MICENRYLWTTQNVKYTKISCWWNVVFLQEIEMRVKGRKEGERERERERERNWSCKALQGSTPILYLCGWRRHTAFRQLHPKTSLGILLSTQARVVGDLMSVEPINTDISNGKKNPGEGEWRSRISRNEGEERQQQNEIKGWDNTGKGHTIGCDIMPWTIHG